jgi:hypothetical protein
MQNMIVPDISPIFLLSSIQGVGWNVWSTSADDVSLPPAGVLPSCQEEREDLAFQALVSSGTVHLPGDLLDLNEFALEKGHLLIDLINSVSRFRDGRHYVERIRGHHYLVRKRWANAPSID